MPKKGIIGAAVAVIIVIMAINLPRYTALNFGSLFGGKEELTPEELAKATSKEKILKDLVLAQRKAKYGSPEWLKIVAAIAEYNKIKQDDIQVEDTTCHFYLPLNYPNRCEDCLIFKNGKSKLKPKSKS